MGKITNQELDTTLVTQLSNSDSHIANTSNPHSVTAGQVGADPTGTATSAVSTHNSNGTAHSDIRTLIGNVTTEVENARGGQANLDARLDGFDTQLAQKANLADPAFTGNPTALTQAVGNSSTRLATTAFVQTALGTAGSPGEISFFAMSSAPNGWLKANGASVSRTTYSSLFAAIGTTFGVGDGSTTFNLPDLRGEFLRGWDDSRGVDSGRAFGSTQTDDNKSHTHNLYTSRVNNGNVSIYNGCGDGTNVNTSTGWMYASGGTEARPRNIALLACIKY